MKLDIIAVAQNGFVDKFGIPRQSQSDSHIETRIVMEKEYSDRNAFRGLDGYSHLWLIWGFSQAQTWSATVRPPRLGGNVRMGVFATRSPFRPNHLGLSSVRLLRVEEMELAPGDKRVVLVVTGGDLMNGTPIYDIKPYLSYSDSHPEARNGFADAVKDYCVRVDWGELAYSADLDEHTRMELTEILQQDPRPSYQDDPDKEYRMDYKDWNLTFCVKQGVLRVVLLEKRS